MFLKKKKKVSNNVDTRYEKQNSRSHRKNYASAINNKLHI